MRTGVGFLAACLVLCSTQASMAQSDDSGSTTYVLRGFSTFQEGCFAPCMCPIFAQFLGGTFVLTPAGPDGEFETFAITDVSWIATIDGSGPLQEITGSGTFRIGAELQQLALDLQFDGGAVERYDSGLVPVGVEFPTIDAIASVGDLFCYDKAVDILAKPLDENSVYLTVGRSMLSWTVVPDSTGYDVVSGDLGVLRANGGEFAAATEACLADNLQVSMVLQSGVPEPGRSEWFLVRGLPGATYDSHGLSQVGVRDREVDAAPASCP